MVTELATPSWSESVEETARGQLPYGEEIIRPGPLNFTSLFIPFFENFLLTTAFSLIPGRQERGGEEAERWGGRGGGGGGGGGMRGYQQRGRRWGWWKGWLSPVDVCWILTHSHAHAYTYTHHH